MAQIPVRERIARYVVAYLVFRRNDPVWNNKVYQDLYAKYPKHVTFKMVCSVLRNKRVFEDMTPSGKGRFGRQYRIRPAIYIEDSELIVRMFF